MKFMIIEILYNSFYFMYKMTMFRYPFGTFARFLSAHIQDILRRYAQYSFPFMYIYV